MAVMAAVRIGVKDKMTGQIVRYSCICIAGNTAEQLDASLCKSVLCTGTNTAAENDIHMVPNKEAHQSTMPLSIGRNDSTAQNLAVFCIVDLELCRVTKVLEHLTVFVRNCDFHSCISFYFLAFIRIVANLDGRTMLHPLKAVLFIERDILFVLWHSLPWLLV